MGQILGLGVTHYTSLRRREISAAGSRCVWGSALPEHLRSLDNWPEPMRRQWAADDGAGRIRCASSSEIDGFAWRAGARRIPTGFLCRGETINSRITARIASAVSVLAYDAVEFQPWLHNQRGVNLWNEPKEEKFFDCGHRQGGKYLASFLLNEGFDIAYAYKPLHAGWGHALSIRAVSRMVATGFRIRSCRLRPTLTARPDRQ